MKKSYTRPYRLENKGTGVPENSARNPNALTAIKTTVIEDALINARKNIIRRPLDTLCIKYICTYTYIYTLHNSECCGVRRIGRRFSVAACSKTKKTIKQKPNVCAGLNGVFCVHDILHGATGRGALWLKKEPLPIER